jgi:dephospho-CoA kinase
MRHSRAAPGANAAVRAEGAPVSWVVGLTGGIGSGKSAVAETFAALGVPITDTDRLAHTLTAPGAPGCTAILAAFGPSLFGPDGRLDRQALRQRAFANADDRQRLEALLHPLIAAEAGREIASWTAPYGLLVVPLLLERGGLRSLVNRILVVDCPEDEQVRRAMARSGMAEREVRAIMATQLPRAHRLAAADDVIDNGGARECLAPAVANLDQRYRELAGGSARSSPMTT